MLAIGAQTPVLALPTTKPVPPDRMSATRWAGAVSATNRATAAVSGGGPGRGGRNTRMRYAWAVTGSSSGLP